MGLLRDNGALSWEEVVEKKDEIKRRGVRQFIEAYMLHKSSLVPHIAFGDELELIMAGKEENGWKLILSSNDVVNSLNMPGLSLEYASYMLEISAKVPYNAASYLNVEEEILRKISVLTEHVKDMWKGGCILMLPVFPNLSERFFSRRLAGGGCMDAFKYEVTKSDFFPDEGISNHSRFRAFTQNIRNRRGKKIEGYVEVMKDAKTQDRYIKIDSMGQGMGCCCLQVTVQASTLDEGRLIYDMIGAICPILLRMTAGSPIAQGKLLNTETRWDMLSMSVDCRTTTERGNECDVSPVQERPSAATIFKSRFSSIDLYISKNKMNRVEYNDLSPPIDEASYNALVDGGVDEEMARHIASLFVRDPILAYKSADGNSRDDFENIQSSNWRSMRFKLPGENAESMYSGFMIETRVMEMQATAFENAAFVYFNFLLSRAVAEYRCNFYIPLSLVDENFLRANLFIRDREEYSAKLSGDRQMFYYRTNIFDEGSPVVKEGTICEIMNGNKEFYGIVRIIRDVIREKFGDSKKLHRYIDFVEKKSRGVFMSLGDWTRRFVFNHRSYRNDSNVDDEIVNDLLDELKAISARNEVEYLLNSS